MRKMKDSGECPRPPFVKGEVIRKNDRGIFKELGVNNV